MAGTDIAIDLGSANFRLYVDGKGVVVDEPNVIAVDEDSNRVVAVGRRAYKMLGRTSDRVRVVKPVTGGVISDLTLMDATLQHYLKKVTNSRVFMPRAVVAVPSGITEVERRAVVDAVAANGIRKVCLIEAPVAAAIGAGLDISRPHGSMVVTLGEGVSDIGVLSMNRLSVSGSIAVGGAVFNEDIIKYARRKFDLIIGEQTAEAAKCAVGCAFPLKDIEKYELRGRDERNGLPAKVEVTSDEIGEAMLESVVKVVHKIRSVLEETPPELTADIGNAGIVLTGGGAKLRGLDTLISKQTKMRVRIAEEPEDCVILGAGRAVQWIDSVKMDAGKENGNVPLTAYYLGAAYGKTGAERPQNVDGADRRKRRCAYSERGLGAYRAEGRGKRRADGRQTPRVGACGRKPRGIGAGSLFEKRRISLAQRNSLRLFFTEICVPVLRAAGCGAAVSGESEAAQEERALGI